MTLAERITAWMDYRGLSVADVAKGVGVKWPSAYEWTRGSVPKQANLEKLIELLGITMEQFYGPIQKRKKAVRS